MTTAGARVLGWLLPPAVRLDAAVRRRWSGVGGGAAAAIGGGAAALALRAQPAVARAFGVAPVELVAVVALSAGLGTWAGVFWLLAPERGARVRAGVLVGAAVAIATHPLAWGLSALLGGGSGPGEATAAGVAARSAASLLAVGWFTVPLCALGGYWVGRRFSAPSA